MEWKLYKMKIEQAFSLVKINFLETTEKGPSNKILFVSLPNTTEKWELSFFLDFFRANCKLELKLELFVLDFFLCSQNKA